MVDQLRPFQRRFLRAALAPKIDTSALSMPRGNGKSWLAAHVLARCLTPGDRLHVPGAEYLLCAASLEQARLCFRFIRHGRWSPPANTGSWTLALGSGLTHVGHQHPPSGV